METRNLKSLLVRTSVGSFAVQITATILGLAVSIIITRTAGAAAYGVYALAMAIAAFLAIPTQLGIPEFLLRQTAWYKIQKQWKMLRGILLRANQAVILVALAIASTGVLILQHYQHALSSDQYQASVFALVLFPLLSLGALRMAALQGLQYPVLGQVPDGIFRPAVIVLSLLTTMLIFGQEALTNKTILFIAASAAAGSFLLGAFLLYKTLPMEVKGNYGLYQDQIWAKDLLPFTILAGTQIFNTKLDIIMLGYMQNAHDTGLYAVATKIALLLIFGRMAIVRGAAPIIAALWANQEIAKVQRVATIAARASLAFAFLIAIPVFLFTDELLSTVFGVEFTDAATPLLILASAWLYSLATGLSNTILKMSGYERDAAWGAGIAAGLNVVFNLLLIPEYGLNGASTATAISLCFQSTYLYYQAYRHSKIEASVLGLAPKINS